MRIIALRRINTILDSNKVLVMDDGVVAEFDRCAFKFACVCGRAR